MDFRDRKPWRFPLTPLGSLRCPHVKTKCQSDQILLGPPSPVQSVLDHVHQFKLSLLFDGQDVDEGLVEHGSSGQLGDDLGGLLAARCRDVDLLGEPDVAVLHGKERVVGSHPHLRDRRRRTVRDLHYIRSTRADTESGTYVSARVKPHQPLCCKDVTRMHKVTF